MVGPAGVGKTRLAVEVAAGLGLRPWWVDLGAIALRAGRGDVGRCARAPAGAGACARPTSLPPASPSARRCSCSTTASTSPTRPPGSPIGCSWRDARILATSREPLRVAGERLHRLEGLELPHAIRLFLDRAGPGVVDADAVTELVERLDGLPLAIELAAGKLPWVSAAELARDLHDRLSLLGDGPRTAPARQRTLEAAIAWSYELLSDDDRPSCGGCPCSPATSMRPRPRR